MKKYKIAIIGAGKLAFSLTDALKKAGYDIQVVISRKITSANSLSNKFSIPVYSNKIEKIPTGVNLFFLTVPDGEIKKTADALSRIKNNFKDNICIHFSGVETIDALRSVEKKSGITGSIHIIRPFPSRTPVDIKNSPASIEAKNKTVSLFIKQLCRKLKLKPHTITSEQKVFQHIAAVHSSNFLIGNLFNAFLLISAKSNTSKNILRKTTQSALDNIFNLSPAKALSGPVDRGDVYAISKHLNALNDQIKKTKNEHLILLRKNYIIQSLSLLNVVKAKYGKLSGSHQVIKKILSEELKR